FVRSVELRAHRLRRLDRRWQQLSTELEKLRLPPGPGRHRYTSSKALQKKVDGLLKRTALTLLVDVELTKQAMSHGRSRWVVDSYTRNEEWQAYAQRLGWRTYVTNATSAQLDAPAVVGIYRHQVLHERTFSRLKTRRLNIAPVFLRDEQRLVGLTWLLELALRILTLTEFRLRRALSQTNSHLTGLNPAAPSQATQQPTADRVLAVFQHINLTMIDLAGQRLRHVTALTQTQRQILALLELPADLYDRLAWSPP